ncbi:ATP/DNA binding protein [Rhynchospora pubera]|uniref:ATP/DNA binding protein n=1 Tax=Rhynchospora pubera TaxID=906938 RepID=A0AAV8G2M6_9POAL|nr:ATP/DNA binding protein [Rhynchospora pubera]
MSGSNSGSGELSPREHVEKIRRDRFFIGRKEKNPLAEDMHQAVNYLSEELYSKDVHFLMELIQNAEDNEYPSGVAPSLEFVLTSEDITATGATSTLLIFNNEKGFSPANIESICRVGKSTKKGQRCCGYIGEKGIGFKSVFLVSSQPHIFSNGYQIKFNEEPSSGSGIGYIVPEWVDKIQTLFDLKHIYGSNNTLPTTIIVLPLKDPKIGTVRKELSEIHPEILLFLSKIRKLSVREIRHNASQKSALTEVSILSETDYKTRKDLDAESYTIHLDLEESGNQEQCTYFMWKQKFPIKPKCRVKKREEMEQWTIVLAFPLGQRLGGAHAPGIYAFLPTEMVTNFPFIIQADFLLASSRETILHDNPWNKGILDCVPSAFVNALSALVKSTSDASTLSVPLKFKFLPIQASPLQLLESVRLSIKDKVLEEYIIPCESYTQKRMFCKPGDVGRLNSSFSGILFEAQRSGLDLQKISSHGPYVLSSCFETGEFDNILAFLGIRYMNWKWYARCLEESDLVMKATEEVYMKLLCFLADNWQRLNISMLHIPILKYENLDGERAASSISRAADGSLRLCIVSCEDHISWLINSNHELGSISGRLFMPLDTQKCLKAFPKRAKVMNWLQNCGRIEVLTVYNYGCEISRALQNRRLAIVFAHFLYHSQEKGYLDDQSIRHLCALMPIIDNHGSLITKRTKVLVPARCSKWFSLMGSNPWRSENYIELSGDYGQSSSFAGNHTPENKILAFIQTQIGAADVPYIYPPNANCQVFHSPLTQENALLLLQWIRNMMSGGAALPSCFLNCVKNGSWIKTSVGYNSPKESFFCTEECTSLLQIGYGMVSIPIIDQEFYGNIISSYSKELRTIGVKFEFSEASELIGNKLMQLLTNGMSNQSSVISLLGRIRYLREKHISPSLLIEMVIRGKWLLTCFGYKSPAEALLFSSEWRTALCIANLPFIDENYYGERITDYKVELELLGVHVRFRDTNNDLRLVVDKLKFPPDLSTAEASFLLFKCICHVGLSENYLEKLKHLKWVKTNQGISAPSESMLLDPEWNFPSCVLDKIPVIDVQFYGVEMESYRDELRRLGVAVTLAESSRAVSCRFMQLLGASSITKENVLSLLECYRQIKNKKGRFPVDLISCMKREKWLSTKMGMRKPGSSVLFNSAWESISSIANVPFIEYSSEIRGYKDELRTLGVAITLEEGVSFVLQGINLPMDPTTITASNSLLLLKCMKCWNGPRKNIPKEFIGGIKKKWLKTVLGYRCPEESLLFDLNYSSLIQRDDAPFIDEEFYGSEIALYKNQLRDIGVKVDMRHGCSLVSQYLKLHSDRSTINRIYMFLKEFKWEPENRNLNWLWVLCEDGKGDWVNPKSCVLHDGAGLFGSQLYVLEKFYDEDLLNFFSIALCVRYMPSIEDYLKLWRDWENSTSQHVKKLPVLTKGGITLITKLDVFIADDILLEDLFDESLFVWYPSKSIPFLSQSKLTSIYTSLGVIKFSEAVEKNELYKLNSSHGATTVVTRANMIREGLVRIILAFLANPSFDICAEKRHEMVQSFLDLTIIEVDELVTMQYKVMLSGGRQLEAKTTRMFHWKRDESRLFIRQFDELFQGADGRIKFATYFSDEISQGLLCERADLAESLAELIKVGCLLDYEAASIEFLIKSKNLKLFAEDEEFLSANFSTEIQEEIMEESSLSVNTTILPSPLEGQLDQGEVNIWKQLMKVLSSFFLRWRKTTRPSEP